MEKFCQSCGMPLKENNIGTEKNGTKSNEYCYLCYANGEFLNKNIKFDEMLKLGINGIEKSEDSKLKKWFLKKTYPMQLKNLKRWKN